MKVFSDVSTLSALDTWLRETNVTAQAPAAATSTAAAREAPSAVSVVRDVAEALLDMDPWNGGPVMSRQLATTAVGLPAPNEQAASMAQRWADHIFSPLL